MLTERSMDDAEVEEDLGSVRDGLEAPEAVVEFVVVVRCERRDPGLNLLLQRHRALGSAGMLSGEE
jgi:hypothetical protein